MSLPPFPWESPDCIQGIDVAYPQERLTRENWQAMRDAGVVSVSIKATDFTEDGRPLVDGLLERHQENALAVGMVVDYYAFIHSNLSGRVQAEHFAKTVEKRPRMARYWADFEDQRRIMPDRRRAFDCLCEFMSHSKTLLGEDGAIYTGLGAMALLYSLGQELEQLARYDLAVAHYRVDPATGHDYGLVRPNIPKPWTKAVFWQITGDKGPRFDGVSVDIDRDVWLGTRAEFDAWCHQFDRHEPLPTFPSTTVLPIGVQDRAEAEVAEDEKAGRE